MGSEFTPMTAAPVVQTLSRTARVERSTVTKSIFIDSGGASVMLTGNEVDALRDYLNTL